jgi:Protein of unknown function (DUF2750)
MPYPLNKQHYDSIMLLPAPKRYQYFVKRAADWKQVWTIQGDKGWLTAADDSGILHLPLWPHPFFAEMCTTGDWSTARVVPIEVHDLINKVLPQLISDEQMVSIMPTSTGRDIPVNPDRLRADLLAELEKIE